MVDVQAIKNVKIAIWVGQEDLLCKPEGVRLLQNLIPDEVVYISEVEGAGSLYFAKANNKELVEDLISELKGIVRTGDGFFDEL